MGYRAAGDAILGSGSGWLVASRAGWQRRAPQHSIPGGGADPLHPSHLTLDSPRQTPPSFSLARIIHPHPLNPEKFAIQITCQLSQNARTLTSRRLFLRSQASRQRFPSIDSHSILCGFPCTRDSCDGLSVVGRHFKFSIVSGELSSISHCGIEC